MKISEINLLSREELEVKLQDAKKQLMDLQFKRKTGVEKPHLFKETKKNIARILTVLRGKVK